MSPFIRRALSTLVVPLGIAALTAAPALASGQAYPLPGFASSNASCIGTTSNFSAHYGAEGESFPTIVHGSVGPAVSHDATSGAPGTVGAFDSTLAQEHGWILECVS